MESSRRYAGVAAADRRTERRQRLIDAGFDLVAEQGLAGMTVTQVCATAGLTERYFYESFRRLDDLRAAMYDALITELRGTGLEAIDRAEPDLYAKCRAATDALCHTLTTATGRARLYFEANGSPALLERRDESIIEFAGLLAEQMIRYGDVAEGHPRLRLQTVMIVGGVAEAVRQWLAGGLAVEPAELIDTTAALCVQIAGSLRIA
ncbi:TetR/AcrR family transcriptional regulator [Nocardia stercoris]|nr:TetR/AcrR family transcriptional regulator [Nocardia stercoris]